MSPNWAVFLLILALILFLLELIIPSGGILGIMATISFIAGLIFTFLYSVTLGIAVLVAAAVLVPLVLLLAFRIFPYTFAGKRLILADHQESGPRAHRYDPDRDTDPESLLGQTGVAVTGLRPVGTCRFESRYLECLAEGGIIDPGATVKITSVHGLEIKVRPV